MDIDPAKNAGPDMDVKGPGLADNLLAPWRILVFALIVVGGTIVYHIYDDYHNITGIEHDRLTAQARVIDRNMTSQLEAVNLALTGVLKNMPYWLGLSGRDLVNRRLQELCDAMPGVRTILITGPEGIVLASNREEIVGKNLGYRDYFRTPLRSQDTTRLYISAPFRSLLGTFVINVTRIIPGPGGEFSGIVSASLDPEYFKILMSSVLYAPDMWSALAHADGILFLMTPEQEGQVGKDLSVSDSFFTRHKKSGKTENVLTGMAHATSEKRMMAFHTFNPPALHLDKPLYVAVSRDLNVIYSDWRVSFTIQGVLFTIMALAMSIGLYVYQRRQRNFDMQERRSVEAFRALSEELERFFDMSLDLLCIADIDGRFRKLNRAWEETLGYTIEELEGESFLDYVHKEDMEATLSAIAELSDKKPVLNFVNRYRCKDGSYRWIEWRSVPYQNRLIYAAARDITGRKLTELALKESETKYRIVADNTYDWEFWLSPEGRFLYTSPSCEKISGYAVKEFESDHTLLSRIVHPDDKPLFEGHRHHVVDDLKSDELEFRIIDRNGSERWLAHLCQPVHDEAGKFLGTRGSNRDITERKKIEEALKESRETIFALINAITESVLLIELDGTVVMLNETTAQRFGKSWEAMIGTNIYDLLPPDIASARREKLQQVIETGGPLNFEDVRLGRYILNSIYPLFDERGKVVRLAVFGYDITDRKKAEDALKESEERYRSLFENRHVVMLLIDPETTGIVDANPAACAYYGYDREQMLGMRITDINTSPADLVIGEAHAAERRQKDYFVFRHRLSSGEVRDVEVFSGPIELGGKKVLYSVIHDITDRKQAEEKVNKLMYDLSRSNRELEQFAYVASHDLQEPLRKIASFTELLAGRYRGKHLDEKADTFMEYIVDGATRMQTMINDLLSLSRVTTRAKELVPVNCNNLLARVLQDIELLVKESGAVITIGELPTVNADDVQLGLVFQNVISNAVKYRAKDRSPEIHVSAEKKNGDVVFSIRDNGIGIEPRHFDRIFQLFQRLHTREEYAGTGIGLALCKKIVERHGGRIWVESDTDKGSVFYFTIPVNPH